MTNKSWHLEDAEKIQKSAPYTFYRPSKKLIEQLQPGNIVKLIFAFESSDNNVPRAERMWVIITKIDNGKYTGKLDNDPYYIKDLKYEDIIEFEEKHIITTNTEESGENIVEKYLKRCLVSNFILQDRHKAGLLYQEEVDNPNDSGWVIFAGHESQEYLDNPNNLSFVSLGAVLNIDDSFIDLLNSPTGTSFIKRDDIWIDENS